MKNNAITIIRIPQNIKNIFQKQCDENLVSMSTKIRQLILENIRKNK